MSGAGFCCGGGSCRGAKLAGGTLYYLLRTGETPGPGWGAAVARQPFPSRVFNGAAQRGYYCEVHRQRHHRTDSRSFTRQLTSCGYAPPLHRTKAPSPKAPLDDHTLHSSYTVSNSDR